MIGDLSYDDFKTLWLRYEKDHSQAAIDKAWGIWCAQHNPKSPYSA